MEITKERNNSSLTLHLAGRLDTLTSPELEKEIDEELEGVTDLTFDLKDLDYVSSAGLRVILKAQKEMNRMGTMKVCNVNDTIMEIFEVTGFTDILTIC